MKVIKYSCIGKEKMVDVAQTVVDHMANFPLVTLSGDLGTGKTYLAGLIIKMLNPKIKFVPSPTFSIINTYDVIAVPGKLHHCDLYRIQDMEALYNLDLADFLKRDLVLVEWPDIARDLFDQYKRLAVKLHHIDDRSRSIDIEMIK
jgi:tRNA threonylcarbamoyl adenosine modification protein YjeE